jgi:hypothetical protein
MYKHLTETRISLKLTPTTNTGNNYGKKGNLKMTNKLNEKKGTLFVEFRNVYGNELVYPVNDYAKLFAELSGNKTLTREALLIAKKLGFTVLVSERDTDKEIYGF